MKAALDPRCPGGQPGKVLAPKRDFAAALRRVVRGVGRLERDVVCCDVTLQQFDTMRLLADSPKLNMELAHSLGIDLSTASRNLAKLEAAGYVERVRVAEDGRATANRLTRKGKRCLDTLVCDERLVLGALANRLPADRRELAAEMLAELASAVEAEVTERTSARTSCSPATKTRRSTAC